LFCVHISRCVASTVDLVLNRLLQSEISRAAKRHGSYIGNEHAEDKIPSDLKFFKRYQPMFALGYTNLDFARLCPTPFRVRFALRPASILVSVKSHKSDKRLNYRPAVASGPLDEAGLLDLRKPIFANTY
jgi:hypothetical protein